MIRILVILFFVALTTVIAEELVLVVDAHSPIETLSKKEIQDIYLKKRVFIDGLRLTPINLPPQNRYRQYLENNILKMSRKKLDIYWMKEHYRGHRPPFRVESEESVLRFVKKLHGGIGYIPLSYVDENVKILYRIEL